MHSLLAGCGVHAAQTRKHTQKQMHLLDSAGVGRASGVTVKLDL